MLGHPIIKISDTKIDRNSRQNFILSPRFPLQSCRSRLDLQLCSGTRMLRMKFCLEFWSIFAIWVRIQGVNVGEMQKVGVCPKFRRNSWHTPTFPHTIQINLRLTQLKQRLTETLDKTSSSDLGSHCKVVEHAEIYNYMGSLTSRASLI